MPEVSQLMEKVKCIKHPRSAWYIVPIDESHDTHRKAKARGISEILCAECLTGDKPKADESKLTVP